MQQVNTALGQLTAEQRASEFSSVYLVWQLMKNQTFDLDIAKARPELAVKKRISGWLVPDDELGGVGGDCFSIATFVTFVSSMVGLEGTVAKTYIAQVTYKADGVTVASFDGNTAVEGNYWNGLKGTWKDDGTRRRAFGFGDDDDAYNAFEAALVYTLNGQTFYIPAGFGNDTPIFDHPNKVILVMNFLDYWVKAGGGWIPEMEGGDPRHDYPERNMWPANALP